MGAAARVDLGAQRARVADRADLGGVAAERQADGPVDDRADLARERPGSGSCGRCAPSTRRGSRGTSGCRSCRRPCSGRGSRTPRGRDSERAAGAVATPSSAGDVVGHRRPLAHGHRRGRRARRPRRRPGRDRGAVADRPDAVHALDRACARRPAPGRASSSGSASDARLGCGLTPAVQTSVRVGISLAGGEQRRVGGRLLEPRAEADVDAAAAQLAQRVVGEVAPAPRAGRGPPPRPGSSACRAGARADSGPSRRRRSPGARRAPRGRSSRRRRRRR